MNGILIIDKEQDFTSHDVVAKLRGICRQKKIGHTGTLDPQATGVLPVCLGNATRLCDLLTDHSKEYETSLQLGLSSDTQDIWGELTQRATEEELSQVSDEQLRSAALSFLGEYAQIPPMYSAKKIDGKKLYELARAGIEVEREAAMVSIDRIEITACQVPHLSMKVSCSKGTYIRTLCHDIGEKLGCGAVMTSLRRTRVGAFDLSGAYTLSQVQALADAGELEKVLLPVEDCFTDAPKLFCTKAADRFLANGNVLTLSQLQGAGGENGIDGIPEDGKVRVYSSQGVFYGIYLYQAGEQQFKPWKLFLPTS